MRDKRQSTPANELIEAQRLAEDLAAQVGQRLRAARLAAGLSQAALAERMQERAFYAWRQTTVAKSEAADRPVLFTEIIALAQILKKDVGFFLEEGVNQVEYVRDYAAEKAKEKENEIRVREAEIQRLKVEAWIFRVLHYMSSAVFDYSRTYDSGDLYEKITSYVNQWGEECLRVGSLFDALEILQEDIEVIDRTALHEAIFIEAEANARLSAEELAWDSTERLNEVSAFVETGKADEAFLATVRDESTWRSIVGQMLTDLLVDKVAMRDRERRF
jgi:transcriptional regulator with XRE-family HTH domain